MASGGARVAFTDTDKARVLATLAANGGNVKRTARECAVSPATIRSWRSRQTRGTGVAPALVAQQVGEFVADATRIRNKALALLESRIDSGDIKPAELITSLGVLDDKIVRAKGQPDKRVEHSSSLPPAEELGKLMAGFVGAAIQAAERREGEILDAEIVQELPARTA